MVILRKKEVTDNKISYYYRLSRELKEGVLTYYPHKNYYQIELVAEGDDYPSFTTHSFTTMKKFYQENNYPDEKIIMWY